jgi:NAD(P)H-dependent FMN reductase
MTPPRILLIAGSAREGALSVRLRDAARRELDAAGARTDVLDLRALDLPLYDGDLEARDGRPAGAHRLRDVLAATDALLLVTPEYNGFPTSLVINAFNWLSRVPAEGDRPAGLAATANKPLALLSSSPGAWGGQRALGLMRQYLGGAFHMLVLPQQFALAKAHEGFDDVGAFKDTRSKHAVADIAQRLVALAAKV